MKKRKVDKDVLKQIESEQGWKVTLSKKEIEGEE
jgi:hypothetical protein